MKKKCSQCGALVHNKCSNCSNDNVLEDIVEDIIIGEAISSIFNNDSDNSSSSDDSSSSDGFGGFGGGDGGGAGASSDW